MKVSTKPEQDHTADIDKRDALSSKGIAGRNR